MPHTNRKKKTPAGAPPKKHIIHTKRQEIEDDEGWTHVIDAPSSRHSKSKSINPDKLSLIAGLGGGDYEIGGIAYVKRTPEELGRDLEYYTRKWEGSEGFRGLREMMEGVGRRKVEDVVCLGLGSLVVARREHRRASWTQFVALRSVMELLGMSHISHFNSNMFEEES